MRDGGAAISYSVISSNMPVMAMACNGARSTQQHSAERTAPRITQQQRAAAAAARSAEVAEVEERRPEARPPPPPPWALMADGE
jgi:hypothetical protein